jgi:hypothetical protein
MAHPLIIALGLLASNPPMAPMTPAPPGSPETRYCLRVDPLIGSHIETIQCKTRDEWAMLGIDIDQEWTDNGVRVIGPVAG